QYATVPRRLAVGPAARVNWHSVQEVKVQSLSTRLLYMRVTLPQTGGAGLALTASPARFRLRPGGEVTIHVKAAFQGRPADSPAAEGTMEIGSRPTLPLRVQWAIPFGRDRAPLLSAVGLSKNSFKPSDTTPAVLSFRAGGLAPGEEGAQVQPVGRLDMLLTSESGSDLGLIVRMRDLL